MTEASLSGADELTPDGPAAAFELPVPDRFGPSDEENEENVIPTDPFLPGSSG